MYSPILYKYQDSYSTVYTYSTHLRFDIPYTHMTFSPPGPNAAARTDLNLPLGKLHIWEVVTW